MRIIADITVDRAELLDIQIKPYLSVHFNCQDQMGSPLPGLGGFMTFDVVSRQPNWKREADALSDTMCRLALEWIARADDYSEPGDAVNLLAVQCKMYTGGGQGFHVRFLRPGDLFESSILFEQWPPNDTYTRNQKVIVAAELVPDIDMTIEAIMGQAYDLAWLVNSEREVKRRPK